MLRGLAQTGAVGPATLRPSGRRTVSSIPDRTPRRQTSNFVDLSTMAIKPLDHRAYSFRPPDLEDAVGAVGGCRFCHR